MRYITIFNFDLLYKFYYYLILIMTDLDYVGV